LESVSWSTQTPPHDSWPPHALAPVPVALLVVAPPAPLAATDADAVIVPPVPAMPPVPLALLAVLPPAPVAVLLDSR
jgi:hypothetical protein